MEQHPVPQNITSFQFRLIGDMTIKQFGYLSSGIILAYISYKLPLPFFFTWPMAVVFALLGFGFAFVPVEERPMDIWFFSFLKNVYNPTVFHWEHTEPLPEPSKSVVPPPPKIPSFSSSAVSQKTPAVQSARVAPAVSKPTIPGLPPLKTPVPQPPHPASVQTSSFDTFFSFVDNLFVTKPKALPAYVVRVEPRPDFAGQYSLQSKQIPTIPTPSVTGKKTEVSQPSPLHEEKAEKHLDDLKTKLEMLQKQLTEKTMDEKRFLELQEQLTGLMTERQQMEKELIALRSKVQSQPIPQPQQFRSAGVVSSQKPNEPTVKTMNPDVATRMGLPRLTTFPNVVTGIVKDNDNNLLPGVLVTVKDKEGIPLRALKTNKLGQFAASTQLPNETYVVEVEDPRERFLFDRVQITTNGTVLPALQIVAKNKRMLEREVLEKQIFGTPNAST